MCILCVHMSNFCDLRQYISGKLMDFYSVVLLVYEPSDFNHRQSELRYPYGGEQLLKTEAHK